MTFRAMCSRLLVVGVVSLAGCGTDGTANPAGVGNRCERDADCLTGTCYLGPGGGYCTSPCSQEGDRSACPADTVCKPIQGGARRCLLICGSASTCREATCAADFCPSGSACVSVANSSLRACEPSP